MEPVNITGTHKIPTVNFDYTTGVLELSGRSMAEDSIKFYAPILTWLDGYIANPPESTTVNIKLEYFNTSSSKCLLDVFKRLEKVGAAGKEVKIFWYYEEENEVILEAGQDYEAIIKLPFTYILMES